MKDLQREIAMEFLRVTEAAALKASRFLGYGDKDAVDKAASDAMRGMLDLISVKGTIVIGEGEKDQAPMLYVNEKVGNWKNDAVKVDIAVDPVDGTRLVANGLHNALAILAAGSKGSLIALPCFYMYKLACGPALKGKLDLDAPLRENLKVSSAILKKQLKDLTIAVLDRDRHKKIIQEARELGARIKLIQDGDVAASLATAMNDSNIDLYIGIGGAPEAVLAAAGLRCLDGEIQTKFYIRDEQEKEKIVKKGFDINKTYYTEDLARGNDIIFCATGVSDGDLLKGVQFGSYKATTYSVVMRAKYKTIRYIKAIHDLKCKTIPSRERNREEKV
ncbi:MAG: class II fructose-bisphosphatase [Clostridia bacterium]|nr:class II fructose-bisphosphatase [Clostridia bacterium]